jgi:hypothetical protein
MKEGCLFVCFVCHVEFSQTTSAYCGTLDTLGKLFINRGALNWLHNVSTYDGKVIETKFEPLLLPHLTH